MITSVYIDIDELVFQLHSVSDDAQKALEWVRAFQDTLLFGARIQNPLPFAMECMDMSEGFSASGVLGKLRAAARKRLTNEGVVPTAEAVDAEVSRTQGADAVREIMSKIERANSLKAAIRRRKFTADAITRDGVDERKAKAEAKPEEQKYPHGEFENIMLTTEEYFKLCERLVNTEELISEADQYFEAQPEKKKKYKNHYAMLLSWDRRRKEAEGPKRAYKTAAEKQRDELQKIADYYASKEVVG